MRYNSVVCGWAALLVLMAVIWPNQGTWSVTDQFPRFAAGSRANAHMLADSTIGKIGNIEAETPRSTHFSGPAVWIAQLAIPFGEQTYRIVFAVIAAAIALVIARMGFTWGWLLIPFSFLAIAPAPLMLATALCVPASLVVFGRSSEQPFLHAVAGLTLAIAPLFEPRALLLCGLFLAYSVIHWKSIRTPMFLVGGGIGLLIAFSTDPEMISVWALPSIKSLATRSYFTLLALDRNAILGHGLLLLLLSSMWCAHQADSTQQKRWRITGVTVLAICLSIIAARLWSAANPFEAFRNSSSLLIWCPWVVALLLAPMRRRHAFGTAFLAIIGWAAFAPAGPAERASALSWILATPLLALDFHWNLTTGTSVRKFALAATAVQTLGIALLVWARADETSDHVRSQSIRFSDVVVCSPAEVAFEFAPLTESQTLLVAVDPTRLFELAMRFRAVELDTFTLCLRANDSLYTKSFPDPRLVRPVSMTITQGGSLYKTFRRSYKLVIAKEEYLWMAPLDQVFRGDAGPDQRADQIREIG